MSAPLLLPLNIRNSAIRNVQWLFVMALFLFGMWTVPLAMLGPDRAFIPGDLGDARFNNYILEHFHLYFSGKLPEYWNAPFMYPWPNVIAHSDNLLGTAPFYSLFRYLGFNRESAFQLWMLAVFALNYWCCYLALKAWSQRVVPSACGAFIFAFGIYGIGQMEHAQVLPRFMIPLAFLFMWRALNTGSWKQFALAALAVVYQFYCGIYLGLFLLYGLFFLAVGHSVVHVERPLLRGLARRRSSISLGVTILVTGLLLLPLLLPYMQVANTLGTRDLEEAVDSIPRPTSYFFSHPSALSWHDLSRHGEWMPEWWNHRLFVGALPWVVVLIMPFLLIHKKIPIEQRRVLGGLGLAWLLSMVFALQIRGFSLFGLVHSLPGFSALRSIDRVVHIQIMFFILMLVAVVSLLPRRGWVPLAVLALLPVLVLLDNRVDASGVIRFDKWAARDMVNGIQRHFTAQRDTSYKAVAYTPVLAMIEPYDSHLRKIHTHLAAMLAAQQSGITITNAYTGSYPHIYIDFFDHMDQRSLGRWCEYNGMDCSSIQRINDLHRPFASIDTLTIQAANGKFVCANTTQHDLAIADRDRPLLWETYVAVFFDDGRVAFRAHNGSFLSVEFLGERELRASSEMLGDYSLFGLEEGADGWSSLRAHDGLYLDLDTVSLVYRAIALEPQAHSKVKLRRLLSASERLAPITGVEEIDLFQFE